MHGWAEHVRAVEHRDAAHVGGVVELGSHERKTRTLLRRGGERFGLFEARLHLLDRVRRIGVGEQVHRVRGLRRQQLALRRRERARAGHLKTVYAAKAPVEAVVELAHRRGGRTVRALAVLLHNRIRVGGGIVDHPVEHVVRRTLHAEKLAKTAPVDAVHVVPAQHPHELRAEHVAPLRREPHRRIVAPQVDVRDEPVRHLVALPLLHQLLRGMAHLDHHVLRKLPERLRRINRGAIADDVHALAGTQLHDALGDAPVEDPELLSDGRRLRPAVRLARLALAPLPAVLLRQLHRLASLVHAREKLLHKQVLHGRVRDAECRIAFGLARTLAAHEPVVFRMVLEIQLRAAGRWIRVAAVGMVAARTVGVRHVVVEHRVVAAGRVVARRQMAVEETLRHLHAADRGDVLADLARREEPHVHEPLHEPRDGLHGGQKALLPCRALRARAPLGIAPEQVDAAVLLSDRVREVPEIGRQQPRLLRRLRAKEDRAPALEGLVADHLQLQASALVERVRKLLARLLQRLHHAALALARHDDAVRPVDRHRILRVFGPQRRARQRERHSNNRLVFHDFSPLISPTDSSVSRRTPAGQRRRRARSCT